MKKLEFHSSIHQINISSLNYQWIMLYVCHKKQFKWYILTGVRPISGKSSSNVLFLRKTLADAQHIAMHATITNI
jgi:hypothetical protein